MAEQLQNFGSTTLNGAINDSTTSVVVTDGSVFPSAGNFRINVEDELMKVTARSTNTLTVERGSESTTAASHSSGVAVTAVQTAESLVAAIRENSVGSGGNELDYTQKTSDTSITATTEGTANTIVTASAINVDGSTEVIVEFFSPYVELPSSDNTFVNFVLTDGGTVVGRPGSVATSEYTTQQHRAPVLLRHRLTPTSGSHTYDIRAFSPGGTSTVAGGAGGASTFLPAYIRIIKADADAGGPPLQDHTEFTSPVSVTATTEGTANTVVTASATTFDGSTPYRIEFYCPYIRADSSGGLIRLALYDGSSSIGILFLGGNSNANDYIGGVSAVRRLTPSAASHTYSVRGYVDTGTGTVGAGAGGSGNYEPGFIRIVEDKLAT